MATKSNLKITETIDFDDETVGSSENWRISRLKYISLNNNGKKFNQPAFQMWVQKNILIRSDNSEVHDLEPGISISINQSKYNLNSKTNIGNFGSVVPNEIVSGEGYYQCIGISLPNLNHFSFHNNLVMIELKSCQLFANDVAALENCTRLRFISLSENYLVEVPEYFTKLQNLEFLDLSFNFINKFDSLAIISSLNKLAYLRLLVNPIADEENYIFKICQYCKNLIGLDDSFAVIFVNELNRFHEHYFSSQNHSFQNSNNLFTLNTKKTTTSFRKLHNIIINNNSESVDKIVKSTMKRIMFSLLPKLFIASSYYKYPSIEKATAAGSSMIAMIDIKTKALFSFHRKLSPSMVITKFMKRWFFENNLRLKINIVVKLQSITRGFLFRNKLNRDLCNEMEGMGLHETCKKLFTTYNAKTKLTYELNHKYYDYGALRQYYKPNYFAQLIQRAWAKYCDKKKYLIYINRIKSFYHCKIRAKAIILNMFAKEEGISFHGNNFIISSADILKFKHLYNDLIKTLKIQPVRKDNNKILENPPDTFITFHAIPDYRLKSENNSKIYYLNPQFIKIYKDRKVKSRYNSNTDNLWSSNNLLAKNSNTCLKRRGFIPAPKDRKYEKDDYFKVRTDSTNGEKEEKPRTLELFSITYRSDLFKYYMWRICNWHKIPIFRHNYIVSVQKVISIQKTWRSYYTRKNTRRFILTRLLRLRACILIQRWWFWQNGLLRRFKLINAISNRFHSVDTDVLYIDSWMFYLLLKKPCLPSLPKSILSVFPEFQGIPTVDANKGLASFLVSKHSKIQQEKANKDKSQQLQLPSFFFSKGDSDNVANVIENVEYSKSIGLHVADDDSFVTLSTPSQQYLKDDYVASLTASNATAEGNAIAFSDDTGILLNKTNKNDSTSNSRCGIPIWAPWTVAECVSSDERHSPLYAIFEILTNCVDVDVVDIGPITLSKPQPPLLIPATSNMIFNSSYRLIKLHFSSILEAKLRAVMLMIATYDYKTFSSIELLTFAEVKAIKTRNNASVISIRKNYMAQSIVDGNRKKFPEIENHAIVCDGIAPFESKVFLLNKPLKWIFKSDKSKNLNDYVRFQFMCESLCYNKELFDIANSQSRSYVDNHDNCKNNMTSSSLNLTLSDTGGGTFSNSTKIIRGSANNNVLHLIPTIAKTTKSKTDSSGVSNLEGSLGLDNECVQVGANDFNARGSADISFRSQNSSINSRENELKYENFGSEIGGVQGIPLSPMQNPRHAHTAHAIRSPRSYNPDNEINLEGGEELSLRPHTAGVCHRPQSPAAMIGTMGRSFRSQWDTQKVLQWCSKYDSACGRDGGMNRPTTSVGGVSVDRSLLLGRAEDLALGRIDLMSRERNSRVLENANSKPLKHMIHRLNSPNPVNRTVPLELSREYISERVNAAKAEFQEWHKEQIDKFKLSQQTLERQTKEASQMEEKKRIENAKLATVTRENLYISYIKKKIQRAQDACLENNKFSEEVEIQRLCNEEKIEEEMQEIKNAIKVGKKYKSKLASNREFAQKYSKKLLNVARKAEETVIRKILESKESSLRESHKRPKTPTYKQCLTPRIHLYGGLSDDGNSGNVLLEQVVNNSSSSFHSRPRQDNICLGPRPIDVENPLASTSTSSAVGAAGVPIPSNSRGSVRPGSAGMKFTVSTKKKINDDLMTDDLSKLTSCIGNDEDKRSMKW